MEHATLDQLYKAVSERLEVGPCQAILGYYVEQEQNAENNRTSLAGIAYAYWFYHWLVRPLAYGDASVLLVTLGLGSMLCALEECERLLPTSLSKTDRDIMSEILIKKINQECTEAKDKSEQFTYWAKRFLTDALLTRINLYDEEESIKSSVEKQLKRFMDALDILEEIARQVLPNPLWRVTHVLTFDEIEALKERIRHAPIRNGHSNVDLDSIDLDRTRRYGDQEFHYVLLYSIVAINYLKMVANIEKVWPMLEDMIPDTDETPLKRIENFFRMENDWCTVFVADIGCEVIVSDNILMKTFDGKKLEPKKVKSEYEPVKRRFRYISKVD